jgi:hypothetical protein
MIYVQLNNKLTTEVYNKRMKYDFHANELKPLDYILNITEKGLYLPMAALPDNADQNDFEICDIIAYCFFVKTDENLFLLDYFAVRADLRGTGKGSEIIKHFSKYNFMGEVEDPDYASDEADKQNRQRRMSFYIRNNLKPTGVKCRLFGSDYVIMYTGENMSDKDAFDKMKKIY